MKERIYSFIKGIYIYLICSAYDFIKSFFWSNMVFKKPKNRQALGSNIMINIHRIEKGLTFKKTKLLFGTWFFPKLLKDIETYKNIYGNTYPINITSASLSQYKELHINSGVDGEKFPLKNIKLEAELSIKSGAKKIGILPKEEQPINEYHNFI